MIYPRLLTGFGILVFFTNISLTKFQVRYMALFCLFSLIDGFGWFWMGSLNKNSWLMLGFLKSPLLVLHYSYHTLMSFPMMLSVILLSMLMILLSTLNGIRHLIFGINQNWLRTWVWSAIHCGLEQEVTCWFQCCKNSTEFVWLV